MPELFHDDLHFVASAIPKDVAETMKSYGLFAAGGFVRAVIAGEHVSDIDLFGAQIDVLEKAGMALALKRGGRLYKTENALTVLAPPRVPVQLITRWTFGEAEPLIASFDFTVAQAAVYREPTGTWRSVISDRFYADLAARRLRYCAPVRAEDAGGSLMRVRKFLAKGYSIQPESLGSVIARLMSGVEKSGLAASGEAGLARILAGLLREVDPLTIVDGFEPANAAEVAIAQEPA